MPNAASTQNRPSVALESRPEELSQDIDPGGGLRSVNVSNVLSEEKKQQILGLGRLGWSLRRIEQAVHIRRETASAYLKAAGIAVRPPGG